MASIKQWGTREKTLFKYIAEKGKDTKATDVVNATQNPDSFRKKLGEYLDQTESAFKSTAAAPILMSIFGQCYLEKDPLKGLANELVGTKANGKSICCLLIEGEGSKLALSLKNNDKFKVIVRRFFPRDEHDEHFKKLIKLLEKVELQNSGYNDILSIALSGMINGESFDRYKKPSTKTLMVEGLGPSEPTAPEEVLTIGNDVPPETKKIIAGLHNRALMKTAKDMDGYFVSDKFSYDPSQFVSKLSQQRNTRPLSAQNIAEVIKHMNDITTKKQREEIKQVMLSNPEIVQNIKKVLNEKTDPKLIETVKKAVEALKDSKFKSDFFKEYRITINPQK